MKINYFFCFLLIGLLLMNGCNNSKLLNYKGQKLFLNGMNLAWIDFARDLDHFQEDRFIAALNDVAISGGNCIRWWLHVNGSRSPKFDEQGHVIGLGPNDLYSLKRAADLAYEHGIVLLMSLWSFDMLQTAQGGVNGEFNKRLIEDKEITQTYIDNALIPIIKTLKEHPGIIAWEICNEPEGMSIAYGWTPDRVEMKSIQQFTNLLTGAIHRIDKKALVTTGTWSFQAGTDVAGLTNYYSDKELIKAGGDRLGTLDFYQIHYYQQHFDEMLSPFHNPASYWKLDKPIVIGEFPAKGIIPIQGEFKPKTELTTSDAYLYLLKNGYAGALSWTYSNHDGFGGIFQAGPGMNAVLSENPKVVRIDTEKLNKLPKQIKPIERLFLTEDTDSKNDVIDLTEYFNDKEDGTDLNYSIGRITNTELLSAEIDNSKVSLKFNKGKYGKADIYIIAEDKGGLSSQAIFTVFLIDPINGNLALFKETKSSSIEKKDHISSYINDGDFTTRWASEYADDQWVSVDLGEEKEISRVVLNWEVAYGKKYDIQVSSDEKKWKTVFSESNSEGQKDEITFNPVKARYVRVKANIRATIWGFSIWEIEIYKK